MSASTEPRLTLDVCRAVLDDVASGMSLTKALEAVGATRKTWRDARRKWPELEAEWEDADRENARVMEESIESPALAAAKGEMPVEAAKLLIATRQWRLMVKHRTRYSPRLDVTSDGKALPAAAVTFVVGRDVVQRVKAEDDLDAGTDEA